MSSKHDSIEPSKQLLLSDLDSRPARVFARRMAQEVHNSADDVVGGARVSRTSAHTISPCPDGRGRCADDCSVD